MILVHDKKYHFKSIFDPKTGYGLRSNVFDPDGNDTGKDPFMASYPELLDIGIMGHCAHGQSGLCALSGVECYQSGATLCEPHMSLEQFKAIIDQSKGRTFQVALGGRGDPDLHEDFVTMIQYAKANQVVPNFTTSGFKLNLNLLDDIRKNCGAVAVSWYRSDYTIKALEAFIAAGVKTNIHYCLSNETIDEAIDLLINKKYPTGVNRIIFLLHKPVGSGRYENVLNVSDPRVKKFFSLFDEASFTTQVGFDSCCVPALHQFTHKIHPSTIEPCEAGRFSAYISPDNRLFPCSFERDAGQSISLNTHSIQEAWESDVFNQFRNYHLSACPHCVKKENCYGGCPLVPEVTLCDQVVKIGGLYEV